MLYSSLIFQSRSRQESKSTQATMNFAYKLGVHDERKRIYQEVKKLYDSWQRTLSPVNPADYGRLAGFELVLELLEKEE